MHSICIIVGISHIWKPGPKLSSDFMYSLRLRCRPHVHCTRPRVPGEVAPKYLSILLRTQKPGRGIKNSDSMLHVKASNNSLESPRDQHKNRTLAEQLEPVSRREKTWHKPIFRWQGSSMIPFCHCSRYELLSPKPRRRGYHGFPNQSKVY